MTGIARLMALAPGDVLSCLVKKVRYRALARRYGFDPWHARSPFECRAYKREVVRLADSLQPGATLEVGCGLGEIVSRVARGQRFGFDIDAAVIPAARHLHGDRCQFEAAGIADTEKIRACIGRSAGADLLIMVNWAHALAWPELSEHVRRLADSLSIRHLIMDTILPGVAGYAHHHTTDELADLGPVLQSIASGDTVRRLNVVALSRP
ncbi:MAG: class I SAM-dependent methyltransferase [Piscinibacter sp.]|nr:class I SAM-dependent methyltransferase [Piscinibacter sp.]